MNEGTNPKSFFLGRSEDRLNRLPVAELNRRPGSVGQKLVRKVLGEEARLREVDLSPLSESGKLLAKPRYRDPSQAITYHPTGPDTAKVIFDQPQRALASGQVIAFYDNEKLLGGGFYK